MRTTLAGFHLEGNGGSWNPGAGGDGWSGGSGGCGGDGWSGGSGGCGGDCGCGGNCGGDCGCKGGGGSCGGKPSGGCGEKPTGGCGGKPSGGGGGLGSGSGQLPLIPDYDGQIWDARLPNNGDAAWPGVGNFGSDMTYEDDVYEGGWGEIPVLPESDRVIKLLGDPDDPLRPQYPDTVAVNECCCVRRICVVKGPRRGTYIHPDTGKEMPVPVGRTAMPLFLIAEYDMLKEGGGGCSFDWKEASKNKVIPGGYKEWKPGEWNSYKKNPGGAANFDMLWLYSQDSLLAGKKGGKQKNITDALMLQPGQELMIFIKVNSGCDSAGCVNCCFLLHIQGLQNDINFAAAGACGAHVCGVDPQLDGNESLFSDLAFWNAGANFAGSISDMAVGGAMAGMASFLKKWAAAGSLGGGDAGKLCVP